MSDTPDGIDALPAALCAAFQLHALSAGQYILETPFQFADGDGYSVVLERVEKGWRLTDLGSTASHLAIDDVDFTKARLDMLVDVAEGSGFSFDDLVLSRVQSEVPSEFDVADLVQAIAQLQTIRYMTREQVRRLYRDDLSQFVENVVPRANRRMRWKPPRDARGSYTADAHLTPTEPDVLPTTVFAVGNADQAERATISILTHKQWGLEVQPLVVVDRRVENRIGSPRIYHLQDAAGDDSAVVAASPSDWSPVERALRDRRVPLVVAS